MNLHGHYILGSNTTAYHLARSITQLTPNVQVTLIIDQNLSHQQLPEASSLPRLEGSFNTLLPQLNPAFRFTITIDHLSNPMLQHIYQQLNDHGFTHIAYIPSLQHLPPLVHAFAQQEITSEYFLNRQSISFPLDNHLHYLAGKDVLITGAGGSIGSEIAKQLLQANPKTIYLLGHGETSIYHTEKMLRAIEQNSHQPPIHIRPIIGELQDAHYITYLLQKIKPHAIFHCAAHKHVPLMELNPIEAIKNNVFSVYHLVEAAKLCKPERLVLISTDKAVSPSNIYGASKALSEEVVLKAHQAGYPFFIVRFGNVLGSRGSILPLFHEQISQGGPLTITDERMQRYWMTIPEATSLVLMAGGVENPHPLYLLDMGKPIKTLNIAKQVAKLYGYDVDKGDIALKYIGLRPGETLEEELVAGHEQVTQSGHPKLLQVSQNHEIIDNAALNQLLENLKPICFFNANQPELFRSYADLLSLLKAFFIDLKSDDSGDWL